MQSPLGLEAGIRVQEFSEGRLTWGEKGSGEPEWGKRPREGHVEFAVPVGPCGRKVQ
jgi:hypothetical protein